MNLRLHKNVVQTFRLRHIQPSSATSPMTISIFPLETLLYKKLLYIFK